MCHVPYNVKFHQPEFAYMNFSINWTKLRMLVLRLKTPEKFVTILTLHSNVPYNIKFHQP